MNESAPTNDEQPSLTDLERKIVDEIKELDKKIEELGGVWAEEAEDLVNKKMALLNTIDSPAKLPDLQ